MKKLLLLSLGALLATTPLLAAEATDAIPRTADGRPDLTGNYDVATLTPLQRPREFGDNLFLTPEEAEKLVKAEQEFLAGAAERSDPDRGAPAEGGAAPVGFDDGARETLGAGNVGGYNFFWVDRGSDTLSVDGKFRTSIITRPANGRMPELTEEARAAARERASRFRPNDGSAWWVDVEGADPYDGPESLPLSERCILGFTGAAPTFPSLYNNYKRIVQTPDYVMILIEMVHDARIVRMNSEHPGPEVRKWLGDSIGWWEGDTLVVDTTNFRPDGSMRGGSENLHVVEKFTMQADGNVLYEFTMEDPTVWTEPWGGEYVWRPADGRVYEYACHEGNYSMGGTLRGARLLESEHPSAGGGGE